MKLGDNKNGTKNYINLPKEKLKTEVFYLGLCYRCLQALKNNISLHDKTIPCTNITVQEIILS